MSETAIALLQRRWRGIRKSTASLEDRVRAIEGTLIELNCTPVNHSTFKYDNGTRNVVLFANGNLLLR